LLLKVALLLGVKFLPGFAYVKTDDSQHRANPGVGLWQVKVETKDKPDFVEYQEQDLCANILVGADGENSLVAKDFEFERKVLQGSRAIGITANFVNTPLQQRTRFKSLGSCGSITSSSLVGSTKSTTSTSRTWSTTAVRLTTL